MRNSDVRKALIDKGMKQWELAEILGISEGTFCRKLRTELPPDEKERIMQVIREYERE